MGGRDPSAAATSRTKGPPIADTRITIVIRPYLLRWPRREEATKVAQKQYSSLLEGLRAVGQVKGWQTQQIVFVGGTCGSVHVESFNKNMKALGVLESK